MGRMIVYLISGYAGSGKDTAGAVFERVGFRRYAFADILKHRSSHDHGYALALTLTEVGKATIVKSTKTHRTTAVRSLLIEDSAQAKQIHADDGYWAKLVADQIERETPKFVVITDWRYNSEYNTIRASFPEAKLTRIRVKRESVKPSQDPSEHELDDTPVDFTIHNNSTIDALTAQCYEVLSKAL